MHYNCDRCNSGLPCPEHNRQNTDAIRWMRHKNGYNGQGIPNAKQFRWELQANDILDAKSPGWWGEEFAVAWAIAVEFGRVSGWKPIVMRFSEREWQQIKKTSPGFCAGLARSEGEYNYPQVKELFLQGYHGCHQIIMLIKPKP